jgi:hypothetical protein
MRRATVLWTLVAPVDGRALCSVSCCRHHVFVENPFGIVLPGEFTDQRGVRRLRPQWIEEGRLPADVLPPQARLFALERRQASFDDQLYAYLTEDELPKYIGRPVRTTTLERLVSSVATLPFPGTMRRLAWLQREIWALPFDTESQIGAVYALCGPTVGEFCARFLHEREHGGALCDGQPFALQRLVVLHARDAPVDEELDWDGMVKPLTALIAVPGTVLTPGRDRARLAARRERARRPRRRGLVALLRRHGRHDDARVVRPLDG